MWQDAFLLWFITKVTTQGSLSWLRKTHSSLIYLFIDCSSVSCLQCKGHRPREPGLHTAVVTEWPPPCVYLTWHSYELETETFKEIWGGGESWRPSEIQEQLGTP